MEVPPRRALDRAPGRDYESRVGGWRNPATTDEGMFHDAPLRRSFLLLLVVLAFGPAASASAAEPPWCGTPEPDAAADLPDGSRSDPPAGSFPHIPYYAIGCTLEDIQARSGGRMKVEAIGKSALGRDMYLVDDQPARHARAAARLPQLADVRAARARRPGRGAGAAAPPAATTSRCRSSSRAASTATSTRASTRRSTAHRAARHDPVRRRPGGRRDPRPRDPGLQPDPEPRRPRRRHPRERQRVRPQPRLPHAVAVRDAARRSR